MPKGLKPTLVPGLLEWIGENGTAARDASKNERTYLKSANNTRYLSHRSRVKELLETLTGLPEEAQPL